MKKFFALLLVAQFILPHGYAQDEAEDDTDDALSSTRDDIILVGAAGVAGAVLGLSTLSFYDKPSQHMSNIWTGAAVGIIAGVIIVAYGYATESQEDLSSQYSPNLAPEFSTAARDLWHSEHISDLSPVSSGPGASWSTSF